MLSEAIISPLVVPRTLILNGRSKRKGMAQVMVDKPKCFLGPSIPLPTSQSLEYSQSLSSSVLAKG